MTARMHRIRRTLAIGLGAAVMVGTMAASDDRPGPRKQVRPSAPVAATPKVEIELAMRPDGRGDLSFDLRKMGSLNVGDVVELSLIHI